MLGIEEILYEVERNEMSEGGLPPGFRFHPTDEELITYYLASKVFNASFSALHIAQVDLNRCEPWELPDVAKMGEREWYFFSLRDRKYPTGLRTNRATGAGYWKATGKDREVYAAPSPSPSPVIGMKKTLVFYKGRAPRGEKTKWVMHEYRLHGHFSCRHSDKEEWVICRIFHKMGEKKSSTLMVQDQNYLIKHNSLPPLLEPPPTLVDQSIMQTLNQNPNPFPIYPQQSDLKTLINPLVSQCDHFQPHPTSFDSDALASNQDLALKELTTAIARQCKKEPDFTTHFQLLSDHGFCQETDHNSFVFGLRGCSGSGGGSSGVGILSTTVGHSNVDAMDAAAIDHVMSTEPAFRWW